MPLEIVISENPVKEDLKIVYSGLLAFNSEAYGSPEDQQLLILLRESDACKTVGGLHGVCFYNWLYITMLFVPDELRGQGFGLQLIAAAENYARNRECIGIYLDTYSFQAPGFYERAGFEKFGELPNFPPGHSRIFFRKLLS